MKRAAIVLALAASLLLASVALAQSGGGYDLHWNTVDGGGYTFHAGGDYALGGTAGQPDAGLLSGGGYILGGGFWCGGTAAQYRIYLPLVLRNHMVYFEGPWESEDNDSCTAANGPLRSGRDYLGYPNDVKDYFSVHLRTAGSITVDLTNHTGQGVQLQLFYQSVDNRVAYALHPPYHIEYTGLAGLYYVYIYTASGYNNANPYTLRVAY